MGLHRRRARLHDGHARAVGQHDGHLQNDAERIADVVRVEFREAFGTIAALQQKCFARSDLSQIFRQRARFARKDEGRIPSQLRLRGGQCLRIGIIGKLPRLMFAPALGGPVRCHGHQSSCRISRMRRHLARISLLGADAG